MAAIQQLLMATGGSGDVVLPFVTVSGGAGSFSMIGAANVTFDAAGTISTSAGTPINIQDRWMKSGGTLWVRGRFTAVSGTGSVTGTLQGGSINTWSSWLASGYVAVAATVDFIKEAAFEFQAATDAGGSNIVATSAVVTIGSDDT